VYGLARPPLKRFSSSSSSVRFSENLRAISNIQRSIKDITVKMVAFSSLYNLRLVFFAVSLATARNRHTFGDFIAMSHHLQLQSMALIPKNSTVQADSDEPIINTQLLLSEKGLVNINVSGENAEELPEGVTIFGPVFFPEKVCVVGDSEAIDMSPVGSPEHAHVDEIAAQDEDEPEPSPEDFDINEAATKLEKRAVRIDSSSITLPLCS
jgi:hypothetical protein